MGWLDNAKQAFNDYGRRHKEHMVSQFEKQAERSKAQAPRPLTETQLVWQRLQQERAQQERANAAQQVQSAARAPMQRAAVTSTPVYTITWHVRLSSLGSIPLPWANVQ